MPHVDLSERSANDALRRLGSYTGSTAAAERGALIPIIAVTIVVSFLMVGLAVDAGNLYLSSILLQRAVDAGAILGAKQMAITPKKDQTDDPSSFRVNTEQRIREMVRANLERRREVDPGRLDIDLDTFDINNDRVAISATWDVDLLLLRVLPGSIIRRLSASAEAEVQKSMVSIIVDHSASMACMPDGNCACGAYCFPKKIVNLRDAVERFVTQFNETRDFFYLNVFSVSAKLPEVYPMDPARHGFVWSHTPPAPGDMKYAWLENNVLGPGNPCDGLISAYFQTGAAATTQFRDRRIPAGRDQMAYVLFVDGPPTAGRLAFTGFGGPLPPNPTYLGTHDYYLWEGTWGPPDPITGACPIFQGVSQFAKYPLSATWPRTWTPDVRHDPSYATLSGGCPDCSFYNTGACGAPDPSLSACLGPPGGVSFTFGLGTVWGGGVGDWTADWRKLFYHCSIAAADEIRKKGGLVYVIGIGPPPTPGTYAASDPYQNVQIYTVRKDILFARIADATPPGFAPGSPLIPQFPGQYREPGVTPRYLTQGAYFPAADATTLDDLFDQLRDKIVRKIKTVHLVR